MYVNRHDRDGSSAIMGQTAEDLFEGWLKQEKRTYRKATLPEQYKHIDFVVVSEKLNKEVTIDVKASKKVSRRDENINTDILWVEFKNVKGNAGWLYGNNDFTAFHKVDENAFYLVKTADLAKLCENLCNQGIVTTSSDALYHRYTRAGRKDELSMIKFEDLKKCNVFIIRLGEQDDANNG